MRRHRLKVAIKLLFVVLLFVLVAAPEWPAFAGERYRLDTFIQMRQFDFVSWELNALATKLAGSLAGGHSYLDDARSKEFVLSYLELLREVHDLEREIETIYANPDIIDPAPAVSAIEAEIAPKRETLATRQPLVEEILQNQVASILVEEGFGILNTAWPPVEMHVTPLPQILIVSPRDEIRQIHNVPLESGLETASKEELEEQIFSELDRSALVVPIGGLGMFPSMIVESNSINFLADVVAHEWAHHWLTMRPVGMGYATSPEMRTINETTASIVGEEIGAKVIERYYPEFVPPEDEGDSEASDSADEERFDFRAEMAQTRVWVDELLTEGKVEEAEAYMEQRRLFFLENGYRIRKLNQAYFAFYGAYADTPGATGGDPVGPAVVALRERSSSLRDFMDRMAFVTSFGALEGRLAR
jgi:hypothetical protein